MLYTKRAALPTLPTDVSQGTNVASSLKTPVTVAILATNALSKHSFFAVLVTKLVGF